MKQEFKIFNINSSKLKAETSTSSKNWNLTARDYSNHPIADFSQTPGFVFYILNIMKLDEIYDIKVKFMAKVSMEEFPDLS